MKQILFLLLFIPIITFCQNEVKYFKYDGASSMFYPSNRPFISESYIDAIDNFSDYIELNQTCYHKINVLDLDPSIPLRDPFCCSTIKLSHEAYSVRGEVYYFMDKYKKALADFNKALELDPLNPFYMLSRGYLYLTLGDYEKAIFDFSGVIVTNPEYYYAYELRAIAYYYRDEYDKCISDFTEVINNSKGYVYDLYNDRGYCYALNKDFENAMSDYRKAILFNPNNDNNDHALVHYRKGLLLESWELDPCKEYQKSCDFGYYKGCEFYSSTKWFCQ